MTPDGERELLLRLTEINRRLSFLSGIASVGFCIAFAIIVYLSLGSIGFPWNVLGAVLCFFIVAKALGHVAYRPGP